MLWKELIIINMETKMTQIENSILDFGWEAKIKEYSLNNKQELAIPDIPNDEFEEDWQW